MKRESSSWVPMSTPKKHGWAMGGQVTRTCTSVAPAWRTMLTIGMDTDNVVARRQAEAVIEQTRTWANGFDRFAEPECDVPADLQDALNAGVEHARTVYLEAADWLETHYLPHTTAEDAVGIERYRFESRRYLGTSLDLEETYHWGWDEVRRLRAEMEALAEEVQPGAGLDAVMDLLKHDPARMAPTPEAFLQKMTELQVDAIARLDGVHFDLPDEILKKLYYKNALWVTPGLPQSGWPE